MQDEFDFETVTIPGADGLTTWQRQRRQALDALARANGLPLGHRCRVTLRDGSEFEGLLELADDDLLIEGNRNPKLRLRVRRCTFLATEMAGIVRID